MIGLSTRGFVGALGYATALIGAGFAAATSAEGDRGPEPYRAFKQAPFAPPAALFGPAWTVNKLGSSWSAARVLAADHPATASARRTALAAAVVNDVAYLAFPLVYFKARSPVLAAAVTTTCAIATAVQLDATRRVDAGAAAALLPQTAWLALATPVAVYQALYNRDPLLRTPAALHT